MGGANIKARVLTAGRISVRAAVVTTALALALTLLDRYEYLKEFSEIDNMMGAMPISLCIVFVGGVGALVFIGFTRRLAPVAVSLAVVVFLSAALFPTSLVGGWWLSDGGSDAAEVLPDLSVYEPFADGNKLAKPSGEPTLVLDGDLPVMDGALALYPVYTAFAEAVYSRRAYESDGRSVMFTNTVKAFDAIIAGERDVIFTAAASKKQLKAASSAGVELCFTPIGKEAFVFLVGKNNPVNNITVQNIRNIYSGKTARWRTLGWNEGGEIVAFRRPEGSGSETGLQSVMRGLPLIKPRPLPDMSLAGNGSLMEQISVEYRGVQPALGYSYRYFANTMYANPDCKMLSVGGVYPSAENIRAGAYPFTVNFYAVTRGEPTGNTKKLVDWILSEQGQSIILSTGYSPL